MNPEAISISLGILALLAVVSFVKEKIENSRFQPPTNQANPSIENAKVSFERTESSIDAVEQSSPVNSGAPATAAKSSTMTEESYDIKSGMWSVKGAKPNQYKLTESMIDKLKYLDSTSFLARTLISTMVPSGLLEMMIKKAQNDELKPGMIIRIAAGKMIIKKP